MNINIYHHYVDKKSRRLLKEILAIVKTLKPDEGLEKQMDQWLEKLKQEFGKLETVSEQVDSKK